MTSIQEDIFTIGSHLAGWRGDVQGQALTGTKGLALEERIKEMETRIDAMESKLPKLSNFILPGGTQLASFVHVARSICRRVERQVVALKQKQEVDSKILAYLNRLSDFLFMVARFINSKENVEEVKWSGIDRSLKKK